MSFSILDLIFPKRCVNCGRFGGYLCKECFSKIEYIEKSVCPVCQRQAVGGKTHPGCATRYGLDGLIVAAYYRGPVKGVITKVKYKLAYDIINILVDLLCQNLYKFDFPKDAILVPVPLHIKRKNLRGFNQSEIFVRSLAQKFGQPYYEALLRSKETKSQVGLKKDDRRKNVKDAFSIKKGVDVMGKNILLVDDVYTSGATMQEACKVLKKAGARSVWAMTIALG